MRVVSAINKLCYISEIHLEDVKIDIMKLKDNKIYKWQYQKSDRLDENLRIATLIRDKYTCQECGHKDCKLEAHHIIPKRLHGANTLLNLITLCDCCHNKTKMKEEIFIQKYQDKIKGKSIRFDYASHVMQGKTYLREQLNLIAPLVLTIGSETANKRIDWDIEKSHSNDAIVITGLKPNTCDLKDWIIKPMRKQSKAKSDNVLGIKHRDLVSYTDTKGITYTGYVTALHPYCKSLSFQAKDKRINKVRANRCKLLWKYNKIYWLDS